MSDLRLYVYLISPGKTDTLSSLGVAATELGLSRRRKWPKSLGMMVSPLVLQGPPFTHALNSPLWITQFGSIGL